MKKYIFEPQVSLHCLSERALFIEILITYDRAVSGEDEKAMSCHDEILNFLTKRGYYANRLSVRSMNMLPLFDDAYGLFLKTLKRSLDPNDILAPGRYDFRKSWPGS